jgi:hypothetical protein
MDSHHHDSSESTAADPMTAAVTPITTVMKKALTMTMTKFPDRHRHHWKQTTKMKMSKLSTHIQVSSTVCTTLFDFDSAAFTTGC